MKQTIRTAPARSKGSSFLTSVFPPFNIRLADTAVIIPMGILTKKIICHENFWVIIPPRHGPRVRPEATTAPIVPNALPRSAAGKISINNAGVHDMIIAAPMP